MGTIQSRERNQNWFLFQFKEAKQHGKMLVTKKLISDFCLQMYAADRTAKEFIKLFENSGKIKIHKDRIEVLR